MRLRFTGPALLALLLLAFVAGCGGGDDTTSGTESAATSAPETIAEIETDAGPYESDEEFVAAVDDYCGQVGEIFQRSPVYGIGPEGLAAEFEWRAQLDSEDADQLAAFEPTDGMSADWQAYVDAQSDLAKTDEQVLAAARKGDVEAANAVIYGDATDAVDAMTEANDALGAECIGNYDAPETPNADPAAAPEGAPEPSNTIEDAADEYLAALQSGDCKQIVAMQHSQNYASVEGFADPETGDCKPLAEQWQGAEAKQTVQYGPVGTVGYQFDDEGWTFIQFVLDADADDALRVTTAIQADSSGLQPANEGNDADQTAADVVAAIRDNDPDALNETIALDATDAADGGFVQKGPFDELGGDPVFGTEIVSDFRGDAAAEPQLLGIDQTTASYLVATEGGTYVLVLPHQPGSTTDYGLQAYWALDSADTVESDGSAAGADA